ncbi:hypothetical protein [uncultured Flavobacterium sp.]|uniref:hypothetical protein n=1 Tax=uncultured Flavobacterium sp. TaxID=165435 RepID=UPI0030EC1F09|tara:strand:- start:2550 stop:3392 length:843 start_codon:yes stop_codon:yes gene_type:complete
MKNQPDINELIQDFENVLSNLKINIQKQKKQFLDEDFKPIQKEPTKEEIMSFLKQFIPYFNYILFFNIEDEKIANKLKKTGFTNNINKWFVNIEEIENEIKRLLTISELIFIPSSYLIASIQHLRLKFLIELIEGFTFILYNNSDSNFLSVDFNKRIRRRNYKKKKNNGKSDYEFLMEEIILFYENQSFELNLEKNYFIKLLLRATKGNTNIYKDLFDFRVINISMNTAYCELFQLMKIIMKDFKLLDEYEFNNKNHNNIYDGNYRFYKYRKVQKILLKK